MIYHPIKNFKSKIGSSTVNLRGKMFRNILFLYIFSWSYTFGLDNCFKNFINHPTDLSYSLVEKFLTKYSKEINKDLIEVSGMILENGNMIKMDELLLKGDINTLKMFYLIRPFLRGYPNELEDMDKIMGDFLELYPKSFLKIGYGLYKDKKIDSTDMLGILCYMGDKYVDKFGEQVKKLKKRVRIINDNKDNRMLLFENLCIDILNTHIKFIKNNFPV